ncbi:hypothetical protein NDU88_000822 [Pleurodeles waltl]|uniref:Uncharacterized protein n=1 Tax=Pleurodeles waltl TaxID=8319 RepID=A0AAV7PAS7_PLEWA|nr:hypothetical protein NDU88_000822 [Pleurodeles waltl]
MGIVESIPASQGAILRLELGEESLDYDEEDPVHGVRSVTTVEKSKMSMRTVQGDRISGRHRELAGNLLRGEVSGYEAGMVGVGYGGDAVVARGKDNVDVAIQSGVLAAAITSRTKRCALRHPVPQETAAGTSSTAALHDRSWLALHCSKGMAQPTEHAMPQPNAQSVTQPSPSPDLYGSRPLRAEH